MPSMGSTGSDSSPVVHRPQPPAAPAAAALTRDLTTVSWQFPDVSPCPRHDPSAPRPTSSRARPATGGLKKGGPSPAKGAQPPQPLTPRQQRMSAVEQRIDGLLRLAHSAEVPVNYTDLINPLCSFSQLYARGGSRIRPGGGGPSASATADGGDMPLAATTAGTNMSMTFGFNSAFTGTGSTMPALDETVQGPESGDGEDAPKDAARDPSEATRPYMSVYRPFSRVQELRAASKPTAADLNVHPSYRLHSEKETQERQQRVLNKTLVEEDSRITSEEIFTHGVLRRIETSAKFDERRRSTKAGGIAGMLKAISVMSGGVGNKSPQPATDSHASFPEEVDFTHHKDTAGKEGGHHHHAAKAGGGSGKQAHNRTMQVGRVSPNRRSGKVIMYDELEGGGLLYDQLSGNVLPFTSNDLLSTNVRLAVAIELTYTRVFTGEVLAPFCAIRLARTVLPQLNEKVEARVHDDENTLGDSLMDRRRLQGRRPTRLSSAGLQLNALDDHLDMKQSLNCAGSDYLKIFKALQGRAVLSSSQLLRQHGDHLDWIAEIPPPPRAARTTKYRSIFDGFQNRATGAAVEEWQQRGNGMPAFRKPNRYGNMWFAPVELWAEGLLDPSSGMMGPPTAD